MGSGSLILLEFLSRQRRALGLVFVGSSCCFWLSFGRIGLPPRIAPFPLVVSAFAASTRRTRPGKSKIASSSFIMDRPTRITASRSVVTPSDDDEAVDSKRLTETSDVDVDAEQKAPKRRRRTEATESKQKATKKRVKAASHQRITERAELPRLWDPDRAPEDSYTFRIASWNVAGLRALMRKSPDALSNLVTAHDIDVLCLQEHKLQDIHLHDPKLKIGGHLLEQEGYAAYWNFSTVKKGYSGTAVFVKKRDDGDQSRLMPLRVTYGMNKAKHDTEGRLINLEFPDFTMTNCYVPNSGQKLERLDYRTEQWDKDFLAFLKETESRRGVPIMWVGDLNIAHKAADVWNDGAKHLDKQAGVTPQERASFQQQLDSGYIDAFRQLHPETVGQYSYWSQRAGNREPNKGLRLDYFVCSPSLFEDNAEVVARDCYILHDQQGSDHCPVVLELELKK